MAFNPAFLINQMHLTISQFKSIQINSNVASNYSNQFKCRPCTFELNLTNFTMVEEVGMAGRILTFSGKRVFSQTKLAMSSQRNAINDATLEAIECMKNWLNSGGIDR